MLSPEGAAPLGALFGTLSGPLPSPSCADEVPSPLSLCFSPRARLCEIKGECAQPNPPNSRKCCLYFFLPAQVPLGLLQHREAPSQCDGGSVSSGTGGHSGGQAYNRTSRWWSVVLPFKPPQSVRPSQVLAIVETVCTLQPQFSGFIPTLQVSLPRCRFFLGSAMRVSSALCCAKS